MANGSGRYTKLAKSFWGDADVRQMSNKEKLAALYMTNRQANRVGLFAFSTGMMAEDLDWDLSEAVAVVLAVCARFGWIYDAAARALYIPGWWKRNAPENDSHFRGCLTDLADVPTTDLLAYFLGNDRHLTESQKTILKEAAARFPDSIPTGAEPPRSTRPPTRVPPPTLGAETHVHPDVADILDVTELRDNSDGTETETLRARARANDDADAGIDRGLPPDVAQAVAACRGHEYLAEMLDPAVTLVRLKAGHPDLDLALTVHRAAAKLTPERIAEHRGKRGGPSGFLTSYFAIAERERLAACQPGGSGASHTNGRSLTAAEVTMQNVRALLAEDEPEGPA